MNNQIVNEKITAQDLISILRDHFAMNQAPFDEGIEFVIEKTRSSNGCFDEVTINPGCSEGSDLIASETIEYEESTWQEFEENLVCHIEQIARAGARLSEQLIKQKCQIQSNKGFDFQACLSSSNPEDPKSFDISITPKAPERGEAYFATAAVSYEADSSGITVQIIPEDLVGLVESDEMSYDQTFPSDCRYEEQLVDDMLEFGLKDFIRKTIAENMEVEASDLNIEAIGY